jgi:signal transduction histidine kinase
MLRKTKKSKLNVSIVQLFKKIRGFDNFILKSHPKTEFLELKEPHFHYNENEINEYINKIFEQQEKERIVRWIVNSIRETLDLNIVLEKITEEIGRLLKVDRCLFALYQKKEGIFKFNNEYKTNPQIVCPDTILNLPDSWKDYLINKHVPFVVNNYELELNKEEQSYFTSNNIKSLIIIPIIHKNEIYGIVMVNQLNVPRRWEDAHIEILKDLGSQISIAIRQAIIYSKLQESTKLKSDYLAGMSHELRTPLNAIIGFSDMLLTGDFGELNEKQRKFITNISLSGNHLLELVNSLLDLSKIEAGCLELNYESFNANYAINEALDILKSMAIQKNILLETSLSDGSITADMLRFKQVMYNLFSNAIKFTQENGKIKVCSEFTDNNFKIEVIDNGIGISEENKEKIFQKFKQINSREKGTGLGLPLAKKLIEAHNGIISVESQEGKGSNFTVVIPVSPDLSNTKTDYIEQTNSSINIT